MALMEAFNRTPASNPDERRRLLTGLLGAFGEGWTHPIPAGPRRDKWEFAEPIAIQDNVWLGGGVIVCPGVMIGENTVVGAGSVVTKDLPPNVVAVGSPARVVRPLDVQ